MGINAGLYAPVLTGTVFHAVSNIAKKKFLGGGLHEDFVTVAIMVGTAFFGFSVSFLAFGPRWPPAEFWLPLLGAGVFNIFIQYLNVKSLKLEDASIVVPLSSAMPLFAIFMSYLAFGEWPTFWGKVGISAIATGAYILYLGGKPVDLPRWLAAVLPEAAHGPVARWGAPWLRLNSSRGARYALLIAYLGAVAVNFDKLLVTYVDPFFATASKFTVVAVSVFGFSWQKGVWAQVCPPASFWPDRAARDPNRKDRIRDAADADESLWSRFPPFWKVFVFGLVFGTVDPLYNIGYWFGIVAYVAALKRVQIFWTVLIAISFLGEGYGRARIIGSVILCAGAMLLSR